jgi:hypothetical protein
MSQRHNGRQKRLPNAGRFLQSFEGREKAERAGFYAIAMTISFVSVRPVALEKKGCLNENITAPFVSTALISPVSLHHFCPKSA